MVEPTKAGLAQNLDTGSSLRDSSNSSLPNVNSDSLSSGLRNALPSNRPGLVSTTATTHPIRIPGSGSVPAESPITLETGPGPTRHPKPLTPAELFAQLEKEQEAVVNRLTRELSILRAAHNSSTVSNNSSTAGSIFPDGTEYNPNHFISGASYPSPSYTRRHRSSSAASNFSNAGGIPSPMIPCPVADRTRGAGTTKYDGSSTSSQPGAANVSRSRNDSVGRIGIQSPHYGIANSPNLAYKPLGSHNPIHSGDAWPSHNQPHPSTPSLQRYSGSRNTNPPNSGVEKEVPLSSRFQDMAVYFDELENLKKENVALRQRVKQLEEILSQKEQANVSAGNELQKVDSSPDETKETLKKVEEHAGGVRLDGSVDDKANSAK